jgi:hypothetical protein
MIFQNYCMFKARSPKDVTNLWHEPYFTIIHAHGKNKFENYLHKQVCNGTTGLSEAQIKMWSQSDNTQRIRLVGILEELIKQAEMEMVHT